MFPLSKTRYKIFSSNYPCSDGTDANVQDTHVGYYKLHNVPRTCVLECNLGMYFACGHAHSMFAATRLRLVEIALKWKTLRLCSYRNKVYKNLLASKEKWPLLTPNRNDKGDP